MPVALIDAEMAGVQYGVVGSYSTGTTAVAHVGLLPADLNLVPETKTAIYHSGPPLKIGQDDGSGKPLVGSMAPSLVGWTALSDPQRRNIERVLAEVRTRMPCRRLSRKDFLVHYVADPHLREVPGEVIGTIKYIRFSCAGLVFYCYELGAGITLVDLGRLPPVPFSDLARVWPFLPGLSLEDRAQVGLPDEKARHILLPGYLFHSLQREELAEPYIPSLDDIVFPRPTSSSQTTVQS